MTTASEVASLVDPRREYQTKRKEFLARLDTHGDWIKEQITNPKNDEVLVYRVYARRDHANGRFGTIGPAPLVHTGSHGGGMFEWSERLGYDFFSEPGMVVPLLQYWIEREDIHPRVLEVIYRYEIRRGISDKTIRIMCT